MSGEEIGRKEAGRAAAPAGPVGDVTSKTGYVPADFKPGAVANRGIGSRDLGWEQREGGWGSRPMVLVLNIPSLLLLAYR